MVLVMLILPASTAHDLTGRDSMREEGWGLNRKASELPESNRARGRMAAHGEVESHRGCCEPQFSPAKAFWSRFLG